MADENYIRHLTQIQMKS